MPRIGGYAQGHKKRAMLGRRNNGGQVQWVGPQGIPNGVFTVPAIAGAVEVGRRAYNAYTSSNDKSSKKPRVRSGKYKGTDYKTSARSGKVSKLSKKRKSSRRAKVSLSKRIKMMEDKMVKPAIRKHRNRFFNQLVGTPNEAKYQVIHMLTPAGLEATTTDLRFIDRGATPSIDSIDLNDQTIAHDIKFRNLFFKLSGRNNGNMPFKLRVYWFKAKSFTSSDPIQLCSTAENQYGLGSFVANIDLYPTDFDEVRKFWKLEKTETLLMNAGDSFESKFPVKKFDYDPKVRDDHTNTFHPGNIVVVMRMEGVIAHDKTTTANVGTSDGTLDYERYYTWDVVYQSDASFKDIDLVNTITGAITTAVVTGPNVVEIEESL